MSLGGFSGPLLFWQLPALVPAPAGQFHGCLSDMIIVGVIFFPQGWKIQAVVGGGRQGVGVGKGIFENSGVVAGRDINEFPVVELVLAGAGEGSPEPPLLL